MNEPTSLPEKERPINIKKIWNMIGYGIFGIRSLYILFFGTLWLIATGIIGSFFIVPLSQGKNVEYTLNGQLMIVSLKDKASLIRPAIFIGIFLLVGGLALGSSLYNLYRLYKLREKKDSYQSSQ